MTRMRKQPPIQQRRVQIGKEIEKVHSEIKQKTLRDFKTADDFAEWQNRRADKLFKLNEELIILDSPEGYNEIPLAMAAEELAVTLSEILEIARQGLLEYDSDVRLSAAVRITRDELGRAIEIGSEELLRVANQTEEEVFANGLQFLRDRDVKSAERCLERIDRFRGYGNPYWICYEAGVHLIAGKFDDLASTFEHIGSQELEDLAAAIPSLKAVAEAVAPVDNVTAVFLERMLAFTDGIKKTSVW